MAKPGDVFVPIVRYKTVPMSQESVGIEFTWAMSEADLRAGRLQTARLLLPAAQIRELAQVLLEQAAIAEQRARPN